MRRIYHGSCHCGEIRFEVTADIDHLRVCDCSVCLRRGALNFRVAEVDFNLQTPIDGLSLYQWGSFTAKDYFCPRCGILPFRRPAHPSSDERAEGAEVFTGWAINVRCLEELNFSALPQRKIEGRKL